MAHHSISLEDLGALNEEIAALVRAGVPLQPGLARLADDLPNRLGQVSRQLAAEMEQGKPLHEALASIRTPLPEVYAALVEAGTRSGRLTVALEAMTAMGRRLVELRRSIVLAAIYPLFLIFVATTLYVGLISKVLNALRIVYEDCQLEAGLWLRIAGNLAGRRWLMLEVIPVLFLLLFAAWWYYSGRSQVLSAARRPGALGWLRPVERMVGNSRAAVFSEILAILIEHGVAAPEAARLAGEASGEPALKKAGGAWSEAIRQGHVQPAAAVDLEIVPPLLRWLLMGRSSQPALVRGLKHAAETYHHRALVYADWLRIYLPIVATAIIAGGIALIYVLSIFIPWYDLLYYLTAPPHEVM